MRRQKTLSRSWSSQYRRATQALPDTGCPTWAPWIRSRSCFTRRVDGRSPMAKLRASIRLDLPGVAQPHYHIKYSLSFEFIH